MIPVVTMCRNDSCTRSMYQCLNQNGVMGLYRYYNSSYDSCRNSAYVCDGPLIKGRLEESTFEYGDPI